MKQLIQNTDDEEPTDSDIEDIECQCCINCYARYDQENPILFVRLKDAKLLWWHVHHCTKRTN